MTTSSSQPTVLDYFSHLSDPRKAYKVRHKLEDIFFITLCAVICGAETWVAIAYFGNAKKHWFEELLGLKHGIPSHDTFANVFSMIDHEEFSLCFVRWVESIAKECDENIISFDGKCLRRSLDKASKKSPIHMVSAWSSANELVLGQQRVDAKSNEITAIPKLLARLNIEGSVITMDAMGCQTAIAEDIIDRKADYMLSLKGNQGNLHDDVKTFFESSPDSSLLTSQTIDGDHGRIETRKVRATLDIDWLCERNSSWKSLKSIVAVTSTREIKGQSTEETRYFISSLDATDPKYLGHVVRSHWGIENKLHWVLDCAFNEDQSRARMGNSAENLAVIRHTSLNILKSDTSLKTGIKTKRLNAGWDEPYLLRLILNHKS
jgi:predicted transposase YbfD/YdcC